MPSSPLFFHAYMGDFCKIIAQHPTESDYVVVDICDSDGVLLNTPYLVNRDNLSNISGTPLPLRSTHSYITEKPDQEELINCGPHPLYKNLLIMYCSTLNAVYLCDDSYIFNKEMTTLLLHSMSCE